VIAVDIKYLKCWDLKNNDPLNIQKTKIPFDFSFKKTIIFVEIKQ
jgi:hypothetical protein